MKLNDLYKLSIEQYREHPRIYWTRNTFFMSIQSALVAFIATDLKHINNVNFTHLIIGMIGLVIAAVWFYVARASRELMRIWRKIVLQIEDELLLCERGLFHRSKKIGEGSSNGVSISSAMLFLAGFFFISWCFLLAYIVFLLVK